LQSLIPFRKKSCYNKKPFLIAFLLGGTPANYRTLACQLAKVPAET